MERLDSVALWRCMCAMHRRRWVSTVAPSLHDVGGVYSELPSGGGPKGGSSGVVPHVVLPVCVGRLQGGAACEWCEGPFAWSIHEEDEVCRGWLW